MKEPEITLFGRKIVLPENGAGEFPDESGSLDVSRDETADDEIMKDQVTEEDQESELCETKPEEKDQNLGEAEDSQNVEAKSESDNNPKTPSMEEDVESENQAATENEQSDATNPQQKTLKKPDKILPCPRCNSMDTKFCYYNNYNVNQPRHFCKACQRYWTAGGTMRNVPVGAGRRKNKNSTSNCRHITISEALQAANLDARDGFQHAAALKPNGTVLSFGPKSSLCESLASVLSPTGQKVPNGVRSGCYKIDQNGSFSSKNGENKDDCSLGSSVTTSNLVGNGERNGLRCPNLQNINVVPPTAPCIAGVPWPFPWNSAVPVPAICPPGYPMPLYPAAFWNCGVPNAWNVPWLSVPSPTSNPKPTGSSPNSPLGKHSRNGELIKANNSEGNKDHEPKNSENSIVVPKILRIDDPEEAAKSSIWSTLGIKYDSTSREGLFRSLQPKVDGKKSMATPLPVLQANPAALSRSIRFQERA